jgi:RNA polymerase sigma factor (sigma-70 family)
MADQAEAALVERARAGDKDAFGELVERYHAMVHRIAARMVGGSPDLAHDLAQEALLQAYLSLRTLRDPNRFASWLYGITLNVCRSYFRERRMRFTSLEALAGGMWHNRLPLIDPTPDPQEVLEERELHARMLQAIGELSPGNRAVVLMHYYDGLMAHEIGALLGITVAAVKGRLHKSRRALHTALARTLGGVPEPETRSDRMAIQVSVYDVVVEAPEQNYIILLLDEAGGRVLPIWIGPWEATSIAVMMGSSEPQRPLTYEFIRRLLDAAGVGLEEARVEAMREDVFYGVAVLNVEGQRQEIDARPSDAIALALKMGSPIYIAEEILAALAIPVPEVMADRKGKGSEALTTQMFEALPHFPPRTEEEREGTRPKFRDRLQAYLSGAADTLSSD